MQENRNAFASNEKNTLTKQESKGTKLIQSIKYIEPKEKSISSRRGSNEIQVIDVEDADEKERSHQVDSNAEARTLAARPGINQLSYTFFINVFNAYLVDFPYVNGFLGIAMIVGMALLTLAVTCWPQHDVILFPEYWYEPIPIYSVVWAMHACNIFWRTRTLMNIQEISAFESVSKFFVVVWLGFSVGFVSIYYFWTKYLGFSHPMPRFSDILLMFTYLLVQPLATWLMFRSDFKTHGHPYRKKIFSLIALEWLRLGMGIKYRIIPKLPLVKHESWQMCLGIVFPVFEKFNMWC